jgi:hypothetical protein
MKINIIKESLIQEYKVHLLLFLYKSLKDSELYKFHVSK